MFRELRRKDKSISLIDTKNLLKKQRRGVLSMLSDDNYPYAVPINYLYIEEDNKIYFHSSKIGQKAESIEKCDKVCFTVYGNETIKQEAWAPFLQSVVIFGRCHLVNDRDRAFKLVRKFANKYYPNKELIDKEIDMSFKAVSIYEIDIEHICGKQIQEK